MLHEIFSFLCYIFLRTTEDGLQTWNHFAWRSAANAFKQHALSRTPASWSAKRRRRRANEVKGLRPARVASHKAKHIHTFIYTP